MRRVFLNGRFLAVAPTGVQRVAEELVLQLDRRLAEDADLRARYRFEILAPKRLHRQLSLTSIGFRQVGAFSGQAWEQVDLPWHARGGILVGLCNFGPVVTQKAVTMIHDAQVHTSADSYSPAFRLWYRKVQPVLGRRHARILTVSEHSRRQIANAKVAPLEAIVVIPNGGDHMLRIQPSGEALARLSLERGGFVLALASTQAHKNIQVLLKAFADPRLASLKLVLFGTADRTALEQMSGASLPDNVVLAGRIDDGELRGLVEAALCLCFPSTTEGFGLPPLEAMVLGCPVVCAPCGATPEVCGTAAVYAQPNAPTEWASAISQLATNSTFRSDRSEQGRNQAKRFTWSAAAERLVRVLDELDAELSCVRNANAPAAENSGGRSGSGSKSAQLRTRS